MDTTLLNARILNVGEQMTPFQRAKFLGDQSVMNLLSEKDRNFLQKVREGRDAPKNIETNQRSKPAPQQEPFEEEPMKAHRFKKYVQYLKRGKFCSNIFLISVFLRHSF